MKRICIIVSMLLGLSQSWAQNEKNLVVDANAEVRNISGFNAIEVSGAVDLYISQGNIEAVAVSASSDEVRSRIRTENRSGTLHIYFDARGLNWKAWGNHKMKAYVTYKQLGKLEASGACNVKATDPIRQSELKMEMSGASDFSGEVVVDKLRLGASGASNIRVSGKAADLVVEASGACNIKAYELASDNCKVDASGASNIRITVNRELNAVASGGSTIFYKGTGLIRDISSSGGAAIKKRTDD